VPYDGQDQDCTGADLTDVGGDGEAAVQADGTDCDDAQAEVTSEDEVYIPAGWFVMGSSAEADPHSYPDERPEHDVYLNAYCIDVRETSNGEYAACESNAGSGCTTPAGTLTPSDYYMNTDYSSHPVVNVTWTMASAYCAAQGKTLPTEAQWEKAARGQKCPDGGTECDSPNNRTYPWGNDDPNCDYANFKPSGELCLGNADDALTATVESHPQGISPFGMLNISGNVSEWVSDYYWENYYSLGETTDPSGPSSGGERAFRGGYYSRSASNIRVSKRFSDTDSASEIRGFRCARSFEPYVSNE